MRHEVIRAGQSIHSAWCACSDCRRRQVRLAADRRTERWLVAFVVMLVAFYGFVFMHAGEILAAFGWGR